MKNAFRKHPFLFSAFIVASALALTFAVSFTVRLAYWSAHQREPVAPWMTVGYVARSWQLSGPEIDALAGLPLPQGRPLTLQQIADDRGVPVGEIVAKVEAAVAELTAREAGRDD